MEAEEVREKIEWEARRIATAFEVETLTKGMFSYRGFSHGILVTWRLGLQTGDLLRLTLYSDTLYCELFRELPHQDGQWMYRSYTPKLNELMVRGLYRLGFEDENVLAQLTTFTAHEKLELRLSMPRELWPQKWLDEVG